MSIKTICECDGQWCYREEEFEYLPSFDSELPADGWIFDHTTDSHYGPSCVEKMKLSGELEDLGIEECPAVTNAAVLSVLPRSGVTDMAV